MSATIRFLLMGLVALFFVSCFEPDQIITSSDNRPINFEELSPHGLRPELGQTDDLIYRLGGVTLVRSFGLREDTENWLEAYDYNDLEDGFAPKVRRAFYDLALSYQTELAHAHDVEKSRKASLQVIRAIDCLYAIVGKEQGRVMIDQLRSQIFTNEYRRAWRKIILENFQGVEISRLSVDRSPKALCSWWN